MNGIYLLKDISQITGQSIHTIKYYLKLGLIKEVGRSPGTNFRYFDASTVECLKRIRELRLKRFSLSKIKEIAKTREEG